MPIVSLFGHRGTQIRLKEAFVRGTLPASLLFQGPRGIGKQRLALWLAQTLLCDAGTLDAPCGLCPGCRMSLELTHPDLHWFFPRPRLKDADASLEDVRRDYAEAIAERVEEGGLYSAPLGIDGIFVSTVRAIVQEAALTPAIARRKVFVIGDAEHMVPQEGSEQAANAFLKLLEEPAPNTTIVLTSSESGALLPTIRSRVVSIRVAPLPSEDVEAFLRDETVAERLDREDGVPREMGERVQFAAGAPGRLLSGAQWTAAVSNARSLLAAATGKPQARYEVAWLQSSSKARGSFADVLDALTVLLHERSYSSVGIRADSAALAASRAVELVEAAKEKVISNVSPQLITANLLRELQDVLT